MESKLYEIAIKTPLRRLFTYESKEALFPGSRVLVPFRNKEKIGIVWGKTKQRPEGLKAVLQNLDQKPLFDEKHLRFYQQAADYYGISLGDLLNSSIPKKIRDGGEIPVYSEKHFVPQLPPLSALQKEALNKILKEKNFSTHLLFGETGSGKTEVYLHLMESILMEGGQILFLVPEISLTPQLEDRLAERLGARVSIFHSNLKESQRLETFARAYSEKTDVFLGARSALFLPYADLKLIIVDEEHDSSYKQAERGAYNARDLAILKAKLLNIPIVLGSATPSMESYQRCLDQTSKIYKLPKFFESEKPEIQVIPLKQVWKESTRSFISEALHEAVAETLDKKEQSLLFLNRRGSATQRVCMGCGHQASCPNCSSGLTLHFDMNKGVCHLCGFQLNIEKDCKECGGNEFFVGGIGTKEIENQIQERFPEAIVARLDRDQTQTRDALSDTLRKFADGKIDILVGTQMISKGIDIPKLSMVGIVLADQGWGVPDFRAMERSFQLLKQVVGRGGRRGQKSKCLIQTFFPEHPVFQILYEDEAFEVFAQQELEVRRAADLPPFSRLLMWTFADKDRAKVERATQIFVQRLSKIARNFKIELVGPLEAPIFRWKNQYRYQVLAKSASLGNLSQFMGLALDDLENRPVGVKVKTDRDPYHFL